MQKTQLLSVLLLAACAGRTASPAEPVAFRLPECVRVIDGGNGRPVNAG
jgi:hypothetical protein